jgi:two-component system chemotaxis response regulator CheB
MPARVVHAILVDSNAVSGEQLRRDLWGHAVLSVTAVVRSVGEALAAIGEGRADVALVDTGVAALASRVPVVAIIAATGDDAAALDALAAGAIDVWVRSDDTEDLAWRACAAATADLSRVTVPSASRPTGGSAAGTVLAIGGGTGSTPALVTVLAGLPADAAAVVATSLPAAVVRAWVADVDHYTAARLAVARDGDRVEPGRLLVAPGDQHLMLRSTHDGGWAVAVKDGPTVHHRRPSLDVLFRSVASAGPAGAAALLGGVGSDGLAGLLAVRRAGGRTVCESPETAVCADRPAHALQCGAAEGAASADRVASLLVHLTAGVPTNRAA